MKVVDMKNLIYYHSIMLNIKKVEIPEIDRVCDILKNVVSHMKSIRFDKWSDSYPTRPILYEDIKLGHQLGAYFDIELTGFIALLIDQPEAYAEIPFLFEITCLVVQRLQVDPE